MEHDAMTGQPWVPHVIHATDPSAASLEALSGKRVLVVEVSSPSPVSSGLASALGGGNVLVLCGEGTAPEGVGTLKLADLFGERSVDRDVMARAVAESGSLGLEVARRLVPPLLGLAEDSPFVQEMGLFIEDALYNRVLHTQLLRDRLSEFDPQALVCVYHDMVVDFPLLGMALAALRCPQYAAIPRLAVGAASPEMTAWADARREVFASYLAGSIRAAGRLAGGCGCSSADFDTLRARMNLVIRCSWRRLAPRAWRGGTMMLLSMRPTQRSSTVELALAAREAGPRLVVDAMPYPARELAAGARRDIIEDAALTRSDVYLPSPAVAPRGREAVGRPQRAFQAALNQVLEAIFDDLDGPVPDMVVSNLARRHIPQFLDEVLFGEALLRRGLVTSVVTNIGRRPAIRWILHAARERGVPTVDAQSLFISPSPRYRASVADRYLVINEEQERLYLRVFGAQAPAGQALSRIGYLGLRHTMRKADLKPLFALDRERGPRFTVLFAAQALMRSERDAVARCLQDFALENPDVDVVIKLHPGDPTHPETLTLEHVLGPRLRVMDSGPIYPVLRGADVVLTHFSNVGLESAILGIPVICTSFHGQTYEVDHVAEGIAAAAASPDQLLEALGEHLRTWRAGTVPRDEAAIATLNDHPEFLRDETHWEEICGRVVVGTHSLAPGEPLLSLCIAYDGGPSGLARCIGSIHGQTIAGRAGVMESGAVEVIVLCGAGAGASAEDRSLLDRLASCFGVRIESVAAAGPGGLLEAAVERARGGLVALVDQQWWFRPGWLEAVADSFSVPRQVFFAAGDAESPGLPDMPTFSGLRGRHVVRLLDEIRPVPPLGSVVFRRSALAVALHEPLDAAPPAWEALFYRHFATVNDVWGFTILDQPLVGSGRAAADCGDDPHERRILGILGYLDQVPLPPRGRQGAAARRAARHEVLFHLSALLHAPAPAVPHRMVARRALLLRLVGDRRLAALFADAPEDLPAMMAAGGSPSVNLSYFHREVVLEAWPPADSGTGRIAAALDSLLTPDAEARQRVCGRAPRILKSREFRSPVIICGFPNSGAGLLAAALDAVGVFQHVDSPGHEWSFFQTLNAMLLPDWNGAEPADGNGAALAMLDPARIAARLSAAGYLGYGPWGLKDLRAGLTAEIWLKAFPNARIVNIVRHPVDALGTLPASYAQQSPSGRRPQEEPEFWSSRWLSTLHRTRAAMAQASRAVEVRYEDFRADPVAVLGEVIKALRLDCNVLPQDLAHLDVPAPGDDGARAWIDSGMLSPDAAELLRRRLEEAWNGTAHCVGERS